jgi:hypothetical protein
VVENQDLVGFQCCKIKTETKEKSTSSEEWSVKAFARKVTQYNHVISMFKAEMFVSNVQSDGGEEKGELRPHTHTHTHARTHARTQTIQ